MDAAIQFTSIGFSIVACIQEFPVQSIIIKKQQCMQAYMKQNLIQVLDAEKLVPLLDAASIYASKVFQVPAMIVIQQTYGRHI